MPWRQGSWLPRRQPGGQAPGLPAGTLGRRLLPAVGQPLIQGERLPFVQADAPIEQVWKDITAALGEAEI